MLAFPLNFQKKAAKTFPLTFSTEHLLHRLYGVDAPGGPVTTKHLETLTPICLFTIQLSGGYDDD